VFVDPSERLRLLSQLQRLLRERLAPRLHDLFDELDLKLFDLAERSRVGAQQHLYFDGLRECRRLRAETERECLDAIVAILRPSNGLNASPDANALRLLGPDELEE
jgi:hypothetical protein